MQGNFMRDKESATVVQLLPPEMRKALEAATRTEKRQPDELVLEAVRQYLKDRHWQMLVNHDQERARSLGHKPSDVNRLVAEPRAVQGCLGIFSRNCQRR